MRQRSRGSPRSLRKGGRRAASPSSVSFAFARSYPAALGRPKKLPIDCFSFRRQVVTMRFGRTPRRRRRWPKSARLRAPSRLRIVISWAWRADTAVAWSRLIGRSQQRVAAMCNLSCHQNANRSRTSTRLTRRAFDPQTPRLKSNPQILFPALPSVFVRVDRGSGEPPRNRTENPQIKRPIK